MKMRPVRVSATFALVFGLLALLPGNARAQDPNTVISAPSLSTPTVPAVAPGAPGPMAPEGSGAARSNTWIPAHKFTLTNATENPPLTYAANHFYRSPGSATPRFYFAPLELEQGLVVDMYTCVFNDSSATNDLAFDLQKTTLDLGAPSVSWTSLGASASSGTPGISFVNISLIADETIRNQIGNTYYHYVLRADVSDDTSFAGCMVYWTRQVSPAPATATFPNDVPTSHPFYKFIEALAASGVTAGCGTESFCPDQPLTRGQMAVFLSSALGLHYPQ